MGDLEDVDTINGAIECGVPDCDCHDVIAAARARKRAMVNLVAVNDPPPPARPRKRDVAGLVGGILLSIILACIVAMGIIGSVR